MKKSMFARFVAERDGGVLIYTALTSAVMLGMVGLAIDVGSWYASRRDMQSAADAASMAGVLEMARGASGAETVDRAKDAAGLNGYNAGEVTINIPPSTGPYQGLPGFVEAIVQRPQGGFVSAMSYEGDMLVAARAVATLAGAPSCVIALDPDDDAALSVSGNTAVTLDCGAQTNSTSDTALSQTGNNASMTATSIQSTGDYTGENFTPDPNINMPPMNDPFTYLEPPAPGICLEPSGAPKVYPSSYTGTVPAGNYCGGLQIQGADVMFETGVYTFDEVGLHISGNGTVTTEDGGVTFYFPPTVTGDGGMIAYIAGSTTVTLTAPTLGPYDGILYYVDPAADPTLELSLKGGSDMALTGVIYAAANHVVYAGNSEANDTWTSIIANTVQFTGTSYLESNGFTGSNVPLALASPSLAE